MKTAFPTIGDFIVLGSPDGYAIERLVSGNNREHVSTEKHRLAALEAARGLARAARTRAWTYELDNRHLEIETAERDVASGTTESNPSQSNDPKARSTSDC